MLTERRERQLPIDAIEVGLHVVIWSRSWSRYSIPTPTATGPASLQSMPCAQLASAVGIDWELMLKALRKHTDCRWVLLYVERWLKAPVQIEDGQRIVRLLVKKILVGEDAMVIRHSVPVTSPPPDEKSPKSSKSNRSKSDSYLLRSGRHNSSLRRSCRARHDASRSVTSRVFADERIRDRNA